MTAYAILALLGGSWPIDTTSPTISNISPLSGASTTSTSPTISVSYADTISGIDVSRIKLTLDGNNVTASSAVTSSGINYIPSVLISGTHSVTVTVSDKKGNQTNRSWSFSVISNSGESGSGSGNIEGGDDKDIPGITSLSGTVTGSGRFTKNVTARSKNSKVKLYIPEDTVGKSRLGAQLTRISIAEVRNPPDPPEWTKIVGSVYDVGPDGATFDPPIYLTLEYRKFQIPEGVTEEKLVIAYWDEEAGEDIQLDGKVDADDTTIETEISHFTNFAILAHARPAIFTTTDLTVSSHEIVVGESITISTIVTNNGDLTGTHQVTLMINGTAIDVKQVEIAGGQSQQVSFIITGDTAGTYNVAINMLRAAYIVKERKTSPELTGNSPPEIKTEPPVPPLPPDSSEGKISGTALPAVPPPASTEKPANWTLIAGIIAGVVVLGLSGFFLVRRFTYY